MVRFAVALAAIVTLALPLASQSFAAQVITSQGIAEALPFAIPSLGLKGDVRPVFGNRLHLVSIALGDEPIETEVRRFVLVTTTGSYEPIGAGRRRRSDHSARSPADRPGDRRDSPVGCNRRAHAEVEHERHARSRSARDAGVSVRAAAGVVRPFAQAAGRPRADVRAMSAGALHFFSSACQLTTIVIGCGASPSVI